MEDTIRGNFGETSENMKLSSSSMWDKFRLTAKLVTGLASARSGLAGVNGGLGLGRGWAGLQDWL
jgi:hypothetical protein